MQSLQWFLVRDSIRALNQIDLRGTRTSPKSDRRVVLSGLVTPARNGAFSVYFASEANMTGGRRPTISLDVEFQKISIATVAAITRTQ